MYTLPTLWGFIFGVYTLIGTTILSFIYRGLPDLVITLKVLGFGAMLSFVVALCLTLIIVEVNRSKSVTTKKVRQT